MANNVRKYLIAGNWKMNKTASEAVDLVKELMVEVGQTTDVGVAVCPPFTCLESVARALEGSTIKLGAQNMHPEPSGAYTGEISAGMLRTLFVNYVILGHSERRQYFGETEPFINKKVLAALEGNLSPILCVGETLAEREAGKTLEVVKRHIDGGLVGVTAAQADRLVIAYEPVWAIGTGKTATPAMAQEAQGAIRLLLNGHLGAAAGAKVRILYGGSMKADNAEALLAQPDIDGGLVGGASLDARSFIKIVQAAQKQIPRRGQS
ncbi:MAG TPA: triose-phosphate isomerase [Opitutales bacterium]|jgi:triosephosphate isomerase|nr:triose-phosphate isomerase [Opitutales bacterium]